MWARETSYRPGGSDEQNTSSGRGSQLIGYQVRVIGFGYGCGPEPDPDAERLNLGPEGRDPGPENGLATAMS